MVGICFFIVSISTAQVPIRLVAGQLIINDGSFVPRADKYLSLTDTLDKSIKINPSDTTSLLSRALLYVQFNNLRSEPNASSVVALKNLTIAKNMVEKAINLKMIDFNLKVLRAQVYKELCYRFSGDESWKFNAKQIAERKAQFNAYKMMANKYYDDLALLDKDNAYDYQKLKVNVNYPIQ
ncbi:hypothetical protein SAMN05428975_1309 [Mucilaginibacter sp. OK268]|nr:hypothetical protein SAMN05428975_1309 [Mucilaginibacter sp. OK268]